VRPSTIAAVLFSLLVSTQLAAREARLLRFADIHEDRVAFVHAGDIWIGPSAGGQARRLTSHEGMELFPKFSPDGAWIAYSAEYGGSRQVFVIGAGGGAPRQLTWYNDVGPMPPRGGFDYRILDWTPDGEEILFRGNRLPWGPRMGRPHLIAAAGGMERPLEVPESGGGMLSPGGGKFVYTPIDREFRTWKRYAGGRAQDVWIYDLEEGTSEQITDYPGTDNQPVWVGDTIYFTSDRADGRLNLWAHDLATGEQRQVTRHHDFDVLWPSAGPRQVVYEAGGWLYRYDPATDSSERIRLEVTGDFPDTLPRLENVSGLIEDAALSPSGKRALFVARGEVFTVPAENGVTRNLTRSPGVRERDASWSPDGRWIAYLSDRTGEYEIWLRARDGSGEERQITDGAQVWLFQPRWSPDSQRLAYGDRNRRLHWIDVDGGESREIDSSRYADIADYRWSPDGRWLVYTKTDESLFSSIYAYSFDDDEVIRLTDGFTNDYEPIFDPEGRYLYFLSDRDFSLTFSGYEFNYLYTDPTRVYAATLAAAGPALFQQKSDEEPVQDDGAEAAEENGVESDEGVSVTLDADGFADRVVALPAPAADYRALSANADGAFFLSGQGGDTRLQIFEIESEKVEAVLTGIAGYRLSGDGGKLLYRQGDDYGIVAAAAGQTGGDPMLDLSRMETRIEPRAEWQQIFRDGWRLTRDWFYDPAMHGLDWKAMRQLYQPLVDELVHRADLDYILGELGGELNAGHFYVNWGDMPRPERRDNGLLGAEISAHESGFFRIDRIFVGENWHPGFRSPLTAPGIDVAEGDFIVAVDGRPANEVDNFYELLEGATHRVVTLSTHSSPSLEGARQQRVRPIASETSLRYLDWVASRRQLVDELSGGRIGYIHMPDTAFSGNRELRKYFYPQAHKEALIFDARYNGGGFIPDRMIELVSRTRLSSWTRRNIVPFTTPRRVHVGPKACLINAYSSSGGDAFPYYFRAMGLGPLIGTRTWGGLIGLSGNPGFMDGGSLNIPMFRFYDEEGEWAVEGVGVSPDIEVLDRPELVARGEDPSLEKAVEVLLAELEATPPATSEEPTPPTLPRDRSPAAAGAAVEND
jgi:tricorn protease